MSRESRMLRVLVFLLLLGAVHEEALAQDKDRTVITSSNRHVTLEKGTSLTLNTLDAHAPFAAELTIVPAGRLLQAVVAQKISGKTAKVGDEVRLDLLYPFHFEANGKTVRVPKHAMIQGHITQVEERAGKNAPAQLAFAIDRLVCSEGTMLLKAVAVAVNPADLHSGFGTSAAFAIPANDGGVCRTCADPQRTIDRHASSGNR